MRTRSKRKISNDDEQNSPTKSKFSVNIDQRQIVKTLKQSCIQLVQLIDSSPIDASDRLDFKNGLMSFYESVKLLLKDLEKANSKKDAENLTSNFIELIQGWNSYKNDLLNSIKGPQRTDFISYCYNELLKISLLVNNLVENPPITPKSETQAQKLTKQLASDTSNVLTSYRTLFDHILKDETINIDIINSAHHPLRKLRQELLTKYQPFFYTDSKDKPNDIYQDLFKYIDRVLKKTQHFSSINENSDPAPFQEIDDILLESQNAISSIDPQWENILPENYSKKDRKRNFLIDNVEDIKSSLRISFNESSLTGQSISRFRNSINENVSPATGMESYLKKSANSPSQAKPSSRDSSRLTAKWNQEPLFGAMENSIKILNDKSGISTPRITNRSIEIEPNETVVNNPGAKDELVNQIANAKQRIAEMQTRQADQQKKFQDLKDSFDGLVENSNSDSSNQRLKLEFKSESDVIQQLNYLRSYLAQRLSQLRQENEELKDSDSKQKENGSRQYNDIIQRTQKLTSKNQSNLNDIKTINSNIGKIKLDNERISSEIKNKQRDCNFVSKRVDDLQNQLEELKSINKARSDEIESMKTKMKLFTIDKSSINVICERESNNFDNQFAEIARESKKIAKKEYTLQQNIEQANERNENLVNKLIPDLTYQIEKRAALVRYLSRQAMMEKQRVQTLQLQAFAKKMEKDPIPFSSIPIGHD